MASASLRKQACVYIGRFHIECYNECSICVFRQTEREALPFAALIGYTASANYLPPFWVLIFEWELCPTPFKVKIHHICASLLFKCFWPVIQGRKDGWFYRSAFKKTVLVFRSCAMSFKVIRRCFLRIFPRFLQRLRWCLSGGSS